MSVGFTAPVVEVPVRGVIDEMHRRLVDQAIGGFVP